jgi:alkaline phosphatase D
MIFYTKHFVVGWLMYVLSVVLIQATQQPIQTIGFGSCLKQNRPQPIWDSILGKKPDIFLLLGDNIYGDTQDMKKLQAKWNDFSSISGFKKLRRNSRLLAIWDDHDYGENDAGTEFPKKAESQKIFLDFLLEPENSERRKTPGIYDSVIIGPPGKRVQFILLDTRYFRSPLKRADKRGTGKGPYIPNESHEATILGEDQWIWLEKNLSEQVEIRIIASSIQVVSTSHGWETWGNFPAERKRLIDLLKKKKTQGTIILSGDRHSSEISMLEGALPYNLFDITSSAMNQRQRPKFEENKHRLGGRYFYENFGLLKIEWLPKGPKVIASIRDINGNTVIEYQLGIF